MMDHLLEERANRLLRNMTPAERALWRHVEDNLDDIGFQLEPQVVVGGFIVDFYVESVRVAIEIDGRHHEEEAQREYDEWRTGKMKGAVPGLEVLRFRNAEVLEFTAWIAGQVRLVCQERWDARPAVVQARKPDEFTGLLTKTMRGLGWPDEAWCRRCGSPGAAA